MLTIDREGYYGGRKWKDVTAAFRELGDIQHRFLTRLRGLQRRNGWTVTKNRWVSVVEAHRSGWPHVNLMVYCPELARELAEERARLTARGRSEREAILVHGELRAAAQNAGFGRQSTAEAARSKDALIGYIVKLSCHDMGRSTAELAKITQAPTQAPERFRRLRAGKCFLPPRRKDPAVTGTLVRRGLDHRNGPTVYPLHEQKKTNPHDIAACCYQEERLWIAELATPAVLVPFEPRPIVSTFRNAAEPPKVEPRLDWPVAAPDTQLNLLE